MTRTLQLRVFMRNWRYVRYSPGRRELWPPLGEGAAASIQVRQYLEAQLATAGVA